MDEDAIVRVCKFTFPRIRAQSRINASWMCTSPISSRTHMPRGGAIFEVSRIRDAKIAEQAGACAIVLSQSICFCSSRMINPSLIAKFKSAVSIPIIARVRVGHVVEAKILQAAGVDYIDESEFLETADGENHINKRNFTCPFICGSTNLGEALERIKEGAAMIRTQGIESICGNIDTTVQNVRSVKPDIRLLHNILREEERLEFSGEIGVSSDLSAQTGRMGRLPVEHFAAGGIVAPADDKDTEGAAMIRTQGIVSICGHIAKTVRNVRSIMQDISLLHNMSEGERLVFSGEIGVPSDLAAQTGRMGRLPVVHFAAGGIVTPADAAFMMDLGCDGVFVGPEMFDWPDPSKRARGIVKAVNRYNDPNALVVAMSGLN